MVFVYKGCRIATPLTLMVYRYTNNIYIYGYYIYIVFTQASAPPFGVTGEKSLAFPDKTGTEPDSVVFFGPANLSPKILKWSILSNLCFFQLVLRQGRVFSRNIFGRDDEV